MAQIFTHGLVLQAVKKATPVDLQPAKRAVKERANSVRLAGA